MRALLLSVVVLRSSIVAAQPSAPTTPSGAPAGPTSPASASPSRSLYVTPSFFISRGDRETTGETPPTSTWLLGRISVGGDIRYASGTYLRGGVSAVAAGEGYGADLPIGVGVEAGVGQAVTDQIRIGVRLGAEAFDEASLFAAGLRVHLHPTFYVGFDVLHRRREFDRDVQFFPKTVGAVGVGFEGRPGKIIAIVAPVIGAVAGLAFLSQL